MRALITALVCAAVLAGPATESPRAAELRFAYQSDVASLDPHVLNSIFTLGFLSNVYEGLTRRDAQMEIQSALASEWERVEPTRWRFHLRRSRASTPSFPMVRASWR